jgi:hypothetical protein
MKTSFFFAVLAAALPGVQILAAETAASQSLPTNAPTLRIQVDPRVELLSLIFRLAGNSEYSQGKVPSYNEDVEKQFNPFRDHDAVKLAGQLRRSRGVSFDACMSMAVHLNNVRDLELLVPLDPWPEGLDKRWTARDAKRFLEATRKFVKDTGFSDFLNQQRSLYETTEARIKGLMKQEVHLEWFDEYFGERPLATFTLAPGLLNGGSCYGARCREAGGKESLYCVLGVWKTDAQGLPEFTRDMISTVVHEFGHSYANPIVSRHEAELRAAGEALFKPVADKMRSQAYGNGHTLLCESLVRACEVRYSFRYDGPAAGRRSIDYQKVRGFLWMTELSDLLAEYETNRTKYPTLETFSPRLVGFFNEYSKGFAEKQKALASKKPKVVSLIPANGATGVDPGQAFIQVIFDRPMRDKSWSMVGGGPHHPETTGKPGYDESHKTWTVPVKLKPDWDYEFMLNSESFDAFRSEDGTPLDPVKVRFKTRKSDP